jgi:hypothetical protein
VGIGGQGQVPFFSFNTQGADGPFYSARIVQYALEGTGVRTDSRAGYLDARIAVATKKIACPGGRVHAT